MGCGTWVLFRIMVPAGLRTASTGGEEPILELSVIAERMAIIPQDVG